MFARTLNSISCITSSSQNPAELNRQYSVETATVTGGTSGIGRALVQILASELGSSVITCGRHQDRVDALNANLPGVQALVSNLTDKRSLFSDKDLDKDPMLIVTNNAGYEFGRNASRYLGNMKLLILNAGISGLAQNEKLGEKIDGQTLANRWLVSVLGTYLACEPALAQSGGTVVFVSSPLIHQRHHMAEGLPASIEPYVNLKESIRNGLWRLYSRKDGPLLSTQSAPSINLMFLEPGSVDTEMHQHTLSADPVLASRTLKLKAEEKLRNPLVVARIIVRMAAASAVFDHESVENSLKPPYLTGIRPSKWVHAITDEAYRKELENLHRPVMDPWWFRARDSTNP